MVEGAPHTAKERSVDQLVCSRVPPAPIYQGARGRPAGPRGHARRRNPPPSRSRIPLFPTPTRRGKEGGEGEKERGANPLPNSDWVWEVGTHLGRRKLSLKPTHVLQEKPMDKTFKYNSR